MQFYRKTIWTDVKFLDVFFKPNPNRVSVFRTSLEGCLVFETCCKPVIIKGSLLTKVNLESGSSNGFDSVMIYAYFYFITFLWLLIVAP